MVRRDLEGLSREELIRRAESAGVVRARALTMAELIDELILDSEKKTGEKRPRGWFGRARDLLTSVIDRGLALPDAPRKRPAPRIGNASPPPLPTVTLAEIYAAQGHIERAITTLDEVLTREPDHEEAAKLRTRFQEQVRKTKPSSRPPPPQTKPLDTPVIPAAPASPNVAVGESVRVGEGVVAAPAKPAAPPPPPAEPQVAEEVVFDADEIVAVAVDPSTVYAYWEVRPRTLASSRARDEHGALVVRVVAVTAAQGGPVTDTRDIRVDALFGELFVRGLPENAQVRLSIGYKTHHGYEPFAVGLDLTTPRALPAAQPARAVRRWSQIRAEATDPAFERPVPPSGPTAGGMIPRVGTGHDMVGDLPAPAWVQ
ncbi:MAG: DUF4912 domain-containing protein, partial [Polyangiaceae bacterium]|nr:DUF4912 domain-containing protein [Polyangiaceae bacterium]